MLSISLVVILLLLAVSITTAKNVYTGSVSIGFDQMKSQEDNSHVRSSSREDVGLATLFPIPKQERRRPVSAVQRTVPTASMQYPIKINGVSDASENQMQFNKDPKSKEELELIHDLETVQKLKEKQKELRKHLQEQENYRLADIRSRLQEQRKMEDDRRQLLELQNQRNIERAEQEKEYQRRLASERMRMEEELRMQEEERQKLETEKLLMEQQLNQQKFIEEKRKRAEEDRRIQLEEERFEEERRRVEEETKRQRTEEELRRHLEEERRQRLAEEYRRKQNEEKMKEELRRREQAERELLAETKRQTEELRRQAEKDREQLRVEENRKQTEERNRMLEQMEDLANERLEIQKEKKRLENEREKLEKLLKTKQEERKKMETLTQTYLDNQNVAVKNPLPLSTFAPALKEMASTYAYMIPSQDNVSSTSRPLKKKIIKMNRLQKLKALPIIPLVKAVTSSPSTTTLPYTESTLTTTMQSKLFTIGKPEVVVPLVRKKITFKSGTETHQEIATEKEASNSNYNNFYQEWYKNTEVPTTQATATLPPAWAQQLPTSGGGFYGIVDPRLEGKDMNKEQLDKMCLSIKGLTKAFGIKNPKTFAEQNCGLIRMYYKQVTCEQIVHVMEYCEPFLSARRH